MIRKIAQKSRMMFETVCQAAVHGCGKGGVALADGVKAEVGRGALRRKLLRVSCGGAVTEGSGCLVAAINYWDNRSLWSRLRPAVLFLASRPSGALENSESRPASKRRQ